MKVWIIRAATFIAGLYFFLEFLLPESITLADGQSFEFSKYHEQVTLGLIAMGNMALGLGIINLLLGHGSKVIFARARWFNSLALLVGLVLMMTFSGLEWRDASRASAEAQRLQVLRDFALRIVSDEKNPAARAANAPALEKRNQILLAAVQQEIQVDLARASKSEDFEAEVTKMRLAAQQINTRLVANTAEQVGSFHDHEALASELSELAAQRREYEAHLAASSWHKGFHGLLFQGVFVALGSAMFSLLGFYIASAAYRAFRIRGADSSLMMLAALLVILGQVPFMLYGQSELGLQIYVAIQRIRLWLLSVPSAAAFRAIEIGTGVAALVMSVRMWLSIESKSYGEQ